MRSTIRGERENMLYRSSPAWFHKASRVSLPDGVLARVSPGGQGRILPGVREQDRHLLGIEQSPHKEITVAIKGHEIGARKERR